MPPELLTPNEKRSLEILQKRIIIKDNCTETGLPWKNEESVLSHNGTLTLKETRNSYFCVTPKI